MRIESLARSAAYYANLRDCAPFERRQRSASFIEVVEAANIAVVVTVRCLGSAEFEKLSGGSLRLSSLQKCSRPIVARAQFAKWTVQRFAAADPSPVIRRSLLDVRAVNSSILERRSLRIGEVFALL